MANIAVLTLVGIIVLVVLVVVFFRLRRQDIIGALMAKRQQSSRIVSRAHHVEGMEKVPVTLSLSEDTLYYENPDLEASFELSRIDEVEYSDELATGRMADDNSMVLRVRSHGAAFEFLLAKSEAKKWMELLPPNTNVSPSAHAV